MNWKGGVNIHCVMDDIILRAKSARNRCSKCSTHEEKSEPEDKDIENEGNAESHHVHDQLAAMNLKEFDSYVYPDQEMNMWYSFQPDIACREAARVAHTL